MPLYTLNDLPWNISVAPGASSQPARSEPSITTFAPAARAFTISPEYLIPPSAITGTPYLLATDATSYIAVICGTPIPATTRVVHIEPGPIPTLRASAPAAISSSAAAAVAILPAITGVFGKCSFIVLTHLIMFAL